MRTTVVPAQVTTVEDRIAGSLGLSQLMLLLVPVFAGSILYVILPPFFGYHEYKVVLLVMLLVVCSVLAIRFKGQILLLWMVAIARYNRRPRFFVYSKNSLYNREYSAGGNFGVETKEVVKENIPYAAPQLSTADMVRADNILADPQANVRFDTNKKGELRVYITEVQS